MMKYNNGEVGIGGKDCKESRGVDKQHSWEMSNIRMRGKKYTKRKGKAKYDDDVEKEREIDIHSLVQVILKNL